MEYYKLITHLPEISKEYLFFGEPDNIWASDMAKIQQNRTFSFNENIRIPINNYFKQIEYKELDFNISFGDIEIVSDKFKRIIGDNDITYFPIEVTNYKTKQKYYAIKINNYYDCVDEMKSEINTISKENTDSMEMVGKYLKLGNYLLDNNKVGNAKIFRLEKHFPTIIITEEFVEKIKENNITGLRYVSLLK